MKLVLLYDEDLRRNEKGLVSLGSLSYEEVHEVITVNPGQTVYTLTSIPAVPQTSELILNGVRAQFGIDYTLDAEQLTWIGSVMLESSDSLTIDYIRTL